MGLSQKSNFPASSTKDKSLSWCVIDLQDSGLAFHLVRTLNWKKHSLYVITRWAAAEKVAWNDKMYEMVAVAAVAGKVCYDPWLVLCTCWDALGRDTKAVNCPYVNMGNIEVTFQKGIYRVKVMVRSRLSLGSKKHFDLEEVNSSISGLLCHRSIKASTWNVTISPKSTFCPMSQAGNIKADALIMLKNPATD